MEKNLLYLVIGFLALLVIFWLLNLLLIKKKNRTSVWLSRGVYISGILCVLVNIIRINMTYEVNRGMHFLSNTIVLISIIIAFVRWEKASSDDDYSYKE